MSFIHLHRGLRTRRHRVELLSAAAVNPNATHLGFTTQPSGNTSGNALATQPVVAAQKNDNSTDTAKTGTVTITLNVISGSPVLSGTTTKALSSGVADFSANGLTVTGAGTWTLTASLSGLTSATSDVKTTSSGANTAPNQPTISAGSLTSSGATLTGSAFSDPDVGDTHAASQWQVTTAADTGYASPVISTGDDATNKTSYAATGLTASTNYIARVRYKDSAGNYSAWSASDAFTTSAAGGAIASDSFTGGTLDAAKWTVVNSGFYTHSTASPGAPTVLQANNQIECTPDITAVSWRALASAVSYDLTNRRLQFKVPGVPAGNVESFLEVQDAATGLGIVLIYSGGNLAPRQTDGPHTSLNSVSGSDVTYNATNHLYWSLRHNSGTGLVYLETSPDGSTWTTIASSTLAGVNWTAVTALKCFVGISSYATGGSANKAIFDDFALVSA